MARKPAKGRLPELNEIEKEMSQVRSKGRYRQALRGTIGTVIVVAAIAVLVATLLLPVIRVTGVSMQPGFQPGDILVGRKTNDLTPGDICSFYFNNKLILKRIIAMGGDIVEISEEGRVRVNGTELEEPYVSEYALGQCDLEFPFEVPLNTVFVLGDNRDNSVDSRVTNFGCIEETEIVGKVMTRVWPLNAILWLGF